ncbi:MAG: phosphoribosylanthranilate isomerase [Crocinitomicaceae bacterium]|nr:phosphoribosylanthranilate isomerase [Crocinitomicaceae bacterium]
MIKIKVCGLTDLNNIQDIADLGVDYFGFIFYSPSARFAYHNLCSADFQKMIALNNKVAVFVNENEAKMNEIAMNCKANSIQLHGNESPELCKKLSEKYTVIKAISVHDKLDIAKMKEYQNACDYFLFDTKTPLHGGSGKKFNWNILASYHENTPFFLSGGINPDDAEAINSLAHPMLFGIDLNSLFEIKPGIKDTSKLKKIINQLKK